jgi:NADH:ubiquinone oxidoreductase subunit F (NADH-binding)
MLPKGARRHEVLQRLEEAGGLRPGVAARVHEETGVPEADVYGVATFYHLLAHPDAGVRVCQGLSCKLVGSDALLADLEASGVKASPVACLGRCDQAPAVWDQQGDPATAECPITPSHDGLALDLAASEHGDYAGLAALAERGAAWLLDELEASGLSGRGGAGFPAHRKWRAVCAQPEPTRYVVLNADEGEPGTFKDREILLRRPHLVVEGLAIAARAIEASAVYVYVRGEFGHVKASLRRAVDEARAAGRLDERVEWRFVDGHGAYICGEETALLESIEGRRGLPRLRPPYPVEKGLFGKPTLIHNVETIACVPQIARRGGAWFHGLGRTEPGTRLYCLSGHVRRPGVYEAPMGITLRELLELAGGATGELKAFSPGGASSGFLPAERADLPLDFASLREAGSMLGSAGIVVLDQSADMVEAALVQAIFFEDESCGQCAPCRIGARMLRQALGRYLEDRDPEALAHVREVAWGMEQASICGLGQAAPLPLLSAMKHWPEEFGLAGGGES